MDKKVSILLLYTGGTIGMMKDPVTGNLRAFDFENLLIHIPEIHQLDCSITTLHTSEIVDSSDMNLDRWKEIAGIIHGNYDPYDGFVVLHGSDTMAYTSSALSFMFENLGKPIILTGSQLPIGDLRTDAKENLITSLQLAALRSIAQDALIQEVCIYFEYKLYRGNRTIKLNAEHFEAFSSPNYPELAVSGVHLKVNEQNLLRADFTKKCILRDNFDDAVGVLRVFPGMTEAYCEAVMMQAGLKAIIIETYGSGNAPTADWFISLTQKLIRQGVHIINVTQCKGGSVLMGKYATSQKLLDAGVISGADLTTETAIAKAMYLLSYTPESFKKHYETPLRGEMTIR